MKKSKAALVCASSVLLLTTACTQDNKASKGDLNAACEVSKVLVHGSDQITDAQASIVRTGLAQVDSRSHDKNVHSVRSAANLILSAQQDKRAEGERQLTRLCRF